MLKSGFSTFLARGFVALGARGDSRALVPLAHLPEAGGEVLLPDDALGLDNRRVFAAGRAGTLRVLVREDHVEFGRIETIKRALRHDHTRPLRQPPGGQQDRRLGADRDCARLPAGLCAHEVNEP